MPWPRNSAAASKTSGRSSGSPPENSTIRVPSAGKASATDLISGSVRSPSPLHFHQSHETHRLLQRLVGKKTTTGNTKVRLVSSPRRTRTLVVVRMALSRLLGRHGCGALTEKGKLGGPTLRDASAADADSSDRVHFASEKWLLCRLERARRELSCSASRHRERTAAKACQDVDRPTAA